MLFLKNLLLTFDNLEDESIIIIVKCCESRTEVCYTLKEIITNQTSLLNLHIFKFELVNTPTLTNVRVYTYDR